jgi:hypothetical protein
MPAHRRPLQAKHRARAVGRPKLAATRKPSLLVLECDAPKLAGQGISAAKDLLALAKLVPDCVSAHVPVSSLDGMLRDLGECKAKHGTFDIVCVVGHSSMAGIAVTGSTPGDSMLWPKFAAFLAPVQPKRIALVACQAGAWLPSKALFDGVPSLLELYGSPLLTNEQQMVLLKMLVPLLLAGVRVDPEVMRIAQIANFALTRGVLFRQTRAEFQRSDPVEDLARIGLDVLLNVLVPNLPPLP